MAHGVILMVEDDIDVLKNNREYLELHGFQTLLAESLCEAEMLISRYPVDIVLLDVNMPDGSGLDFARMINEEKKNIPVIFLTGRADAKDIVAGFEHGGSDYITKPFDFEVMLARINARLHKESLTEATGNISCGQLTLELFTQQARIGEKSLPLSSKEFAILYILAKNREQSISAEVLYQSAWNMPMLGNNSAVKTVVSRLRGKLAHSNCQITASRGQGYCLKIAGEGSV